MTAAVPEFPAPDWAEPMESEAIDRPDRTTVFWASRDFCADPAFQVKLVKVDSLEDGERWSSVDAEIHGPGGGIQIRTPAEVDELLTALQALATTWRNAERVS